jgi:hypothetical protein
VSQDGLAGAGSLCDKAAMPEEMAKERCSSTIWYLYLFDGTLISCRMICSHYSPYCTSVGVFGFILFASSTLFLSIALREIIFLFFFTEH